MKINEQGSMEIVDLVNTRFYIIFTKRGNYRGGKTYDKEKKFVLSSGKVILTIYENNEDKEQTFFPWEIITIPAWIPNLFYFPEDSEMIEWFEKEAKSEYFERYKEIKEASINKVKNTLQN